MTDTTDTAELRRRSNNLRTPDQTDAFIDLLLDKIEAERQRADEGAKEITYWCNLNARKNERMGELEAAEKELDEITTGILELIPDCRYMDPPDGGSVTPLEQLSRMVTELRASPQKPVVLPKSHYVCGCADRFMSAPEVIAAIEAAGGIVKDGE